jgi:ubiquinone/menaquinone biosynthesis C-methylase UbiE
VFSKIGFRPALQLSRRGKEIIACDRGRAATFARQERRLQEAAAIARGDRVLDVGCGCGESTRNAARSAAAGWAYGIDIVPQLGTGATRASELA